MIKQKKAVRTAQSKNKSNDINEKLYCPEPSNKSNKKLSTYEIAKDFARDFIVVCNNKYQYIGLKRRDNPNYDIQKENFLARGSLDYIQLSWKEFCKWMRRKYGRNVILPKDFCPFLKYVAGYFGTTVWRQDYGMISKLAKIIARCIKDDYIIEISRQSRKINKMYNRHNNYHEALHDFSTNKENCIEFRFSRWINRWLEDNCGLALTMDWQCYESSQGIFINRLTEKIMHELYSDADIASDSEYIITEQYYGRKEQG